MSYNKTRAPEGTFEADEKIQLAEDKRERKRHRNIDRQTESE